MIIGSKLAHFKKIMSDISSLEKNIGTVFANQDLIQQAVVHRSYLNEHPDFRIGHNERLEFLGDAVLELVVTQHLYNTYPNPEGELTNWRASLVNSKMLASLSKEIKVEDHLLMSKGESKDGNSKARDYILANAFEAIVGAMYLDQGYDASYAFIEKLLFPQLEPIIENELFKDPKSKFQEFAQEKMGLTPTYRVMEEGGPDHDKHFKIGVYLGDEMCGVGEGTSKKEAQESAAQKALKKKNWE